MDDYDIELTPNDPEFGPDECESAYALWAFKEDGEPVKFLEASLVEDPDYPSGYSFSWRSLSCDRTGKLVAGEPGETGPRIGDEECPQARYRHGSRRR